ncbi:MAG: L-threonylcarbamoyladenylate synthase [Candidatus Omnitrophota bacterium]
MRSSKSTEVLKTSPKDILRAARVLRSGGLVAFPTETVYGLGADMTDKGAVRRLYRVKKRPLSKPFAVMIADRKMVGRMGCRFTGEARALTDKLWPGPLTVILEGNGGKKTGFRMPDHVVALKLLKEAKVPLAVPSANLSGNPPPRSAGDVLRDLDGKIGLVLDGGRTNIGVESTVIDMTVTPPRILREGAISRREIENILAHSKPRRNG